MIVKRTVDLRLAPCLVGTTDFTHAESPVLTRLVGVVASGYLRDAASGAITKKSHPAVEFGYSLPKIHTEIQRLDGASAAELGGARKGTHQWGDLDGDGLPGWLGRVGRTLFYKQNLGGGVLAPARMLPVQPSLVSTGLHVLDLDGDGRKEMVFFERPMAGYHQRTEDDSWGPYQPFASQPVIDWTNPNLQFIDLSGDGRDDILISYANVMRWYPSHAKGGFGAPITLQAPLDEDRGVVLAFMDHVQMLFLADMTGDGLMDLVRVRYSSICYWPNLGYGRFGAKIEMKDAPLLDYRDQFDPRRVRLADTDGTGTADLLYIDRDGVQMFINQSGNAFGPKIQLPRLPDQSFASTIDAVDLLGTGTACLVWSSPLPGCADAPARYIDLMGGVKPYLLTSGKNHLGAETRIRYAPSTKFSLADRAAGRPWSTRLPFVVQVVERVATYDEVSRVLLTSEYRYHHGHYDGVEREFCGFGFVEQVDTESLGTGRGGRLFPEAAPRNGEMPQPPVLTKTWFSTGAWRPDERSRTRREQEVYRLDPEAPRPAEAVLPDGLSAEERRQARWTMRGQVLRQEVYALDGSAKQAHPFSVVENGCSVRRVQAAGKEPEKEGREKRPGVFFVAPRETVTLRYERERDADGWLDPRVEHVFAVEVDEYGTVRKSVAVAYPRRRAQKDPEVAAQSRLLATLTETDVVHLDGAREGYRLGIPIETRTSELHGLTAPPGGLSFEAVVAAVTEAAARPLSYEGEPPTDGRRSQRLLGRIRVRYCESANPESPLPFGSADLLALPYESYALAFTPGQIARTFNAAAERVTPSVLAEGGYVQLPDDSGWWMPSGREVVDPARFYLPTAVIDPFGARTAIAYDAYALLVISTRDALGNELRVENDYRMLAPVMTTDANGNHAAVRLDELGVARARAVMGKEGAGEGDTLENPTEVLDYDLFRFSTTGKPNYVHTRTREEHGDAATRWRESYVYFDGSGREIQRKELAEPGPAPELDAEGRVVRGAGGEIVMTHAERRWVATGRTVFNNKGDVLKEYESYFSRTPEFEDADELAQWGVTCVFHYDPMHRRIRTDFPDGTHSRVEYTPWRQAHWDRNDTVLEEGNAWYAARQPEAAPALSAAEQRAAVLAAAHANTPSVTELDPLGRAVLAIADLGGGTTLNEAVALDIEGNPVRKIDARGNVAESNVFGMGGQLVSQISCDAGARWMLANVLGAPLRAWDGRGQAKRVVYDELRRSTQRWIREGSAPERLDGRTVYGETHPEAAERNLRGRVFLRYDGAGVVTNGRYDFKGNVVESARRLAKSFDVEVDWSATGGAGAGAEGAMAIAAAAEPLLEAEVFASQTTYDALNRPTRETAPDGSETRPGYSARGLREAVDVRRQGAAGFTPIVHSADYNARGQLERVRHGNGTETTLGYDPRTFRPVRRRTVRDSDGTVLQNLEFTFDPVGNVVAVTDAAQPTVFFDNAVVEANAEFTVDAVYRLIEATGREHASGGGDGARDHRDAPLMGLPQPNDTQAVRRYVEQYAYDHVGNPLVVRHLAGASNSSSWTRRYAYEPGSNRLVATSLPGDVEEGPYTATYAHDAHGNITRMPHLAQVTWDANDRMREVDLGGGGTAYTTYGTDNQRVRKVIRRIGTRIEERIYLGKYEVYRQRDATGVHVERQTLHVMNGEQRVAMIENKTVDRDAPARTPVPRVRYQIDNHLGSALLETDQTGQVISYEEYSPYGTSTYRAGRSGVEVSAKRYRYTGKERDEETGLYYHGARYYAPWLGRWTAADPIGTGDGLNLYGYAHDNPVRFSDPTGTTVPYHDTTRSTKPRTARKGIAAAARGDAKAPDAGKPASGAGPPAGAAAVGLAVSPGYAPPTAPVTPPGVGVGPGAIVGVAAVLVMMGAIYLLGDREETVTLHKVARPPEPPHRSGSDAASAAPDGPRRAPETTQTTQVTASTTSDKSEKSSAQPANASEASKGAVTYGDNATSKLRNHWGDIQRLAKEHGVHMPGKFKEADSQVRSFIEDIVRLGETRVGPYKPTGGGWPNAIWTRHGNAVVIRSPEGKFVTILDAAGGGAAMNYPGRQ